MKRQIIFGASLYLLTAWLLAGCQGAHSPTPTVTPEPTAIVIPTATSTPTVTPEPTAIVIPTATSTPTVTPIPTATATPRSPGSPTATPVLSEMELNTWSLTSPDKKWSVQGTVAFPVAGGENYYTGLKVKQTGGAVEWIVVDAWSKWGLGYTTPHPLHWSRNGRYLYYTNRPVPGGCGVFVNASDLHRVDLSDGSVAEVMPHSGLWLSLSPDERMLAYIGYAGRGLVLRDLETGAEREMKLDPGQVYTAGHIIWSPDVTALVLTLAFRPCSTDWAESTSVVRVEISSLRQKTLIREDKRLFVTVEWPTLDQVLLRDDAEGLWWMDSETGQVTIKDVLIRRYK